MGDDETALEFFLICLADWDVRIRLSTDGLISGIGDP